MHRLRGFSCEQHRTGSVLESLHYITLHYITLHYITSHHITSHHITSHHITSHHITSHHITSHHITSHHITSHHITSHHITSHFIMFHVPAPCSGQLEETLEAMLATVSSLLLQKENMSDERRRCIQLLDVPPAVAGHMDVVLEDALERATHDIVKSKRDAKLSDRLAQVGGRCMTGARHVHDRCTTGARQVFDRCTTTGVRHVHDWCMTGV